MAECTTLEHLEYDKFNITLRNEIGRGRNEAVVYNGFYWFRDIAAIKRIKIKNHDAAIREIKILSKVDSHANVISYYGYVKDKKYIYIASEMCDCTLRDFVTVQTKFIFEKKSIRDETRDAEERKKFQRIKDFCQSNNIQMFKANKFPTDHTLKLLRAILDGISSIHEQNIYHRDLTPENILLKFDQNHLCVKICDFSISKPIDYDHKFNYDNIGNETHGWKAPHQIKGKEIDTFNFGCIIFYCLTGGGHPFGDFSTHQNGIKIGHHNILAISHIPEAHDTVSSLIWASKRPQLDAIKAHPFLWISKKRIHFLHIASDRVDLEMRTRNKSMIKKRFLTAGGNVFSHYWNSVIDATITNYINSKRGHAYAYNDLSELLRAFRNLYCHNIEHPPYIQVRIGGRPDGILDYFQNKFPTLFFEVFKIMRSSFFQEDAFEDFVK